jgi:hypothetical protein
MKKNSISILILVISFVFTYSDYAYSQAKSDLVTCPENKPIDWMTVKSVLISTKITDFENYLSQKSLKYNSSDFENLVKLKSSEIGSFKALEQQFDLVGDYLIENGVTVIKDLSICREIYQIMEGRHTKLDDYERGPIFKIDDLYMTYFNVKTPRMGLKTIYFFDSKLSLIQTLGF